MESVLMCATVKPLQFIPARGRKLGRAVQLFGDGHYNLSPQGDKKSTSAAGVC